MSETTIRRQMGRTAFGLDPAGYDRGRPGYPAWVYETLAARCGLGPNAAVFEIGPGTGAATRRLLALGANPVVAIEPDPRLARFLAESAAAPGLKVVDRTFEDADLEAGAFDLGFAATSFHWVEEQAGLRKIARVLRPGGWWAAVWNIFGDDTRPDPFHDATRDLLGQSSSPSDGKAGLPFGLDADARRAAIAQAGAFEAFEHVSADWSLVLDAEQTVALYATYSNINLRRDRDAVLAELGRIAREVFADRVTRNMTTSLFTARRAP